MPETSDERIARDIRIECEKFYEGFAGEDAWVKMWELFEARLIRELRKTRQALEAAEGEYAELWAERNGLQVQVQELRAAAEEHARKDYDRIQDPAGIIPEDEPVFLLRAQDDTAADIVRCWADRQSNEDIADLAYKQADAMDAWPKKKAADL